MFDGTLFLLKKKNPNIYVNRQTLTAIQARLAESVV